MNELTIVRAIHVVSIVIWIGGVGFVTVILLPAIKSQFSFAQQKYIFHLIESRFANIAKWMIVIAGISGFYMVDLLNAWDRFTLKQFFWMHAMVLLWFIFSLALFVVEPILEKRHGKHSQNTKYSLQLTFWLHVLLLTVSLVTVFISVLGAHGVFY
jgi:uncharacterized membrane protein